MDQLIVYYARKDKRWIAHSLRTDQIGTGPQPLEAMVDAMKAIKQVMELAHTDPTINPWREAPTRIQKLAMTVGSVLAIRFVLGILPAATTALRCSDVTSLPSIARLASHSPTC